MRIRITHETTYRYSDPVKSAIQLLRLTPRGHDGQTVLSWAIDAWALGRLSPVARARVEEARREAWATLEREAEVSTLAEAEARHAGLPTPEEARRLVRELAASLQPGARA